MDFFCFIIMLEEALDLRYPPLNTRLICTAGSSALAKSSVNIANQKQQSLPHLQTHPQRVPTNTFCVLN